MEITKVSEIASLELLRDFWIYSMPIENLEFSPGAVNIVQLKSKIRKLITGVFSDKNYSHIFLDSKIDSDSKATFIFNLNTAYARIFDNQFLILKNPKALNDFYIIESFNQTFSTDQSESVIVAVLQPLEDFERSKQIRIIVSETTEVNVTFPDTFLLQDIYKSKNGIYEKQALAFNYMPMIAAPISVDKNELKIYFSSLAKMLQFDVRIFKINSQFQIVDNPNNDQINKFFSDLLQIHEKQQLLMSGFVGKSQDFIQNFKEKEYSGSNVTEYVDYKLFNLIESTGFLKSETELIFKMCSGFLKSSYCIDGGLTNSHKFILPFYLDFKGSLLYLKSNFFEIKSGNDGSPEISKLKSQQINDWQYVDYPNIPRELKELNVNVSPKEVTYEDLKYRVNFLLPQIAQDPYSFFKDKDSLGTIKRIKIELSDALWKESSLTLEKIRKRFFEFYDKKNWTIDSEKFRIAKVKIKGLIGYFEELGYKKDGIITDLSKMDFRTKEVADETIEDFSSGMDFRPKIVKYTPIKSPKFPPRYEGGNQAGRGRGAYNAFQVDIEAKALIFYAIASWGEKSAKYYEVFNFLKARNFILTEDDWQNMSPFFNSETIPEFNFSNKEKIVIKGLFLPKSIIINKNNEALAEVTNQTELIINYF